MAGNLIQRTISGCLRHPEFMPMNRGPVNFPETVAREFSFLAKSGFRIIRSERDSVRFRGPAFTIEVFHEIHSFEIGLEIESVQSPSEAYSFGEILRLVDIAPSDQYRDYVARTPDDVVIGTHLLAELFLRCMETEILDAPDIFSRLEIQRQEWREGYSHKIALLHAHRAAETAWIKKDFREVVKALSPYKNQLTRADLKRLNYALKYLDG